MNSAFKSPIAILALVTFYFSAVGSSAELIQIQAPNAPPALGRQPPAVKSFSCQRQYLYRGNRLDCDSNLHRDGENLRPLIADVPAAIAELDQYQRNQKSLKKLAYIGTLGLVMFSVGMLLKDRAEGNNKIVIRNLVAYPGLALIGGSFLYGLTVLSTNEDHLTRAVDHYNQIHPEDRIELQFSTGLDF